MPSELEQQLGTYLGGPTGKRAPAAAGQSAGGTSLDQQLNSYLKGTLVPTPEAPSAWSQVGPALRETLGMRTPAEAVGEVQRVEPPRRTMTPAEEVVAPVGEALTEPLLLPPAEKFVSGAPGSLERLSTTMSAGLTAPIARGIERTARVGFAGLTALGRLAEQVTEQSARLSGNEPASTFFSRFVGEAVPYLVQVLPFVKKPPAFKPEPGVTRVVEGPPRALPPVTERLRGDVGLARRRPATIPEPGTALPPAPQPRPALPPYTGDVPEFWPHPAEALPAAERVPPAITGRRVGEVTPLPAPRIGEHPGERALPGQVPLGETGEAGALEVGRAAPPTRDSWSPADIRAAVRPEAPRRPGPEPPPVTPAVTPPTPPPVTPRRVTGAPKPGEVRAGANVAFAQERARWQKRLSEIDAGTVDLSDPDEVYAYIRGVGRIRPGPDVPEAPWFFKNRQGKAFDELVQEIADAQHKPVKAVENQLANTLLRYQTLRAAKRAGRAEPVAPPSETPPTMEGWERMSEGERTAHLPSWLQGVTPPIPLPDLPPEEQDTPKGRLYRALQVVGLAAPAIGLAGIRWRSREGRRGLGGFVSEDRRFHVEQKSPDLWEARDGRLGTKATFPTFHEARKWAEGRAGPSEPPPLRPRAGRIGPYANLTDDELLSVTQRGEKPASILPNVADARFEGEAFHPSPQWREALEKVKSSGLPYEVQEGNILVGQDEAALTRLRRAWNAGDDAEIGRALGYSEEDIAVAFRRDKSTPPTARPPGPSEPPAGPVAARTEAPGGPRATGRLRQIDFRLRQPDLDPELRRTLEQERARLAEPSEPPTAPKFERTPMGDQALIPGAEAREIPKGPMRAPVPQRDISETPLFGQERAAAERAGGEAQGQLFEPAVPRNMREAQIGPEPGAGEPPARFLGWQEVPGKEPVPLYQLTREVGGRPAQDTVGPETLRELGIDPPAPPPRGGIGDILADESGRVNLGAMVDAWRRGYKRARQAFPMEGEVRKATPDSPLLSAIERFNTYTADWMARFVGTPVYKALQKMQPSEIMDLDEQMMAGFQAGTVTRLGQGPGVPAHVQGYLRFRDRRLRNVEQAARAYFGLEPIPETSGPYLPRVTKRGARESVSLGGGKLGLGRDIQTTVRGHQQERLFESYRQGERVGTEYEDPRNGILLREWEGTKLDATHRFFRELEQKGVLFRDRASAAAANARVPKRTGGPWRVENAPGGDWWARTEEEAKLLEQNLTEPRRGTSLIASFVHYANSFVRTPGLFNPLPHLTKNMSYKYMLARGPVGAAELPVKVVEYARGSNPTRLAEFNEAMPFSTSGRTAADILHTELREGGAREAIKAVERAATSASRKFSQPVVFQYGDPALRYALFDYYRRQGMGVYEAGNHAWMDLVRYGVRSFVTDEMKSIPMNFFVPWRFGSVQAVLKQARNHPVRTAMLVGGIEYLREMRYRTSGRWTHLPTDYVQKPIAHVVVERNPADLPAILGSMAIFGPGGDFSASQIRDLLATFQTGAGRGLQDPEVWRRFRNMYWGFSQAFEVPAEVKKGLESGDPSHMANAFVALVLGEHSAIGDPQSRERRPPVGAEPRRLTRYLPEWMPGLERSREVRAAEREQAHRRERRERALERRSERGY